MMKEKLQSVIFQRGYDNMKIAEKLRITKDELDSKISQRGKFTIEEIINLIDILDIKNPEKIFFPKRERQSIK